MCCVNDIISALRYRLRRGGGWRKVALSEIEGATVVDLPARSWPVSFRAGPAGTRITSTSGRGVEVRLRGRRRLWLGSAEPERLRAALEAQRQRH